MELEREEARNFDPIRRGGESGLAASTIADMLGSMPKQPNILFILSDDHAVQAISSLGSKLNRTPHIDRIAESGGVFEESYCCNSLCTPSRAAILTGKHSYQNGVLTLKDALDDSQITFVQLLREAGYQTAITGKWHLKNEPKDFDFWKVYPDQGSYYNPDYLTPDGEVREEGYSADLTTDTILNWLSKERDAQKPFLACCHFKAPHSPWMPPERHYHLFDDVTFPEPQNLVDDYANRSSVLKENKVEISKYSKWNTHLKVHDPGPNADRLSMTPPDKHEYEFDRMTPAQRSKWDAAYAARQESAQAKKMNDAEFVRWVYQAYLTDYLRVVQAIDDNVGRLLDYLDSSGLAEGTIVVYCSDQGFFLGEHGWFNKRWIFEESMRMPLLMRWPGKITPGSRWKQLVQNIDYAPTFLEACGIATPEGMHGTSLLRVIEDGADIHDDLYYHYYEHGPFGVPAHDGVRTKRYKLVNFYRNGEFNLFDLEKDPLEMVSVHDDPTYLAIYQEMQGRYREARRRWEIPDALG